MILYKRYYIIQRDDLCASWIVSLLSNLDWPQPKKIYTLILPTGSLFLQMLAILKNDLCMAMKVQAFDGAEISVI